MGKRLTVEVGQRFGRLVVIADIGKVKATSNHACALTRCDCGAETVATLTHLYGDHTQSCGCLKRDKTRARSQTHGESKRSPEWRAWTHMIGRCHCPTDSEYHRYGSRGVYVCDEWRQSYPTFLEHIGRRPTPQHSLDRIDNNKGYKPGNVRWALDKDQARNRRSNRLLTLRGKTQCLAAWVEETGIGHTLILYRLRRGWSVEDALSTPIRSKR